MTDMPVPSATASFRSWICPTDVDVYRFTEAIDAINRARRQVLIVLLPASLVLAPWFWHIVTPLVLVAVLLGVSSNQIASRRDVVVSGLVISLSFQTILSAAVALSGGLRSPVLSWLVIPVALLAARYRRTVVVAALCAAGALGGTACTYATWARTGADYPAFVDGIMAIALALALCATVLNLQRTEIQSRQAAALDPLTGLLNRANLDHHLQRMDAPTDSGPSCALVCDIDHFKAVNDTHGHGVGDQVLRAISNILTTNARAQDRIFRLGGEEFLVLLPDSDRETGIAVAERIRSAVEQARPAGFDVTVSIGVAAGRGAETGRAMIEAADEALYKAKASGRNRVRASNPVDTPPAVRQVPTTVYSAERGDA